MTQQLRPTPVPTNILAILAVVCAFMVPPLGIVFGHVARRQIARTGEAGRGLANVGLILGYAWIALVVIIAVALVAVALVTAAPDATPPSSDW